jgi:tRNA nucleotidyltransferase (CCA-adding enzyme)
MQFYEVGGAVRDSILGEPVGERDWVVIGGTPGALLKLGFRRVGKAFPVFLHPESGEEYALARTERKTGPGHTDFSVEANESITLEEDLRRRDLTVNAIARDRDGRLIDPYGGLEDLEQRVLRHVSAAFSEDPLRVLRVARFAARLQHRDFTIAATTKELMAAMSSTGELDTLSPDRVWLETSKALSTRRPDVYFSVLREVGALGRVFPEVDALFGVPQPPRWHPEIDTGVHTLMALRLAAELSDDVAVRFAVLTHDLGKATTPPHILPSHHGHGRRSAELVASLCKRLPVPRRLRELALQVAEHHGLAHQALRLRAGTILKLIVSVDGLRRPERFEQFLLACEADARGRLGLEVVPYTQGGRLRTALGAARSVAAEHILDASKLAGAALGDAIRQRRIEAVAAALAIEP